jgi:predicted Zn-dependent protease
LGNAIFNTQIKKKTYLKDGKVYKIDIKEKRDEKIEIYGYETQDELKAIIAHEILHLIGIGHIDNDGALMNPILQKNQKINLSLTSVDIDNIKNNF